MRLYPKMGDNTKQVRVDNWGIFFLQRLQMFFSKTDYCDMTLQFEGNVQLKVHRLVMNACTEYFQFLEQTCALEDNVIMMPSDLQADVIVPIVNFMYTGMLEFHLSIFDRLYKTAQVMNITILTKLLDAQKQPVAQAIKPAKRKHVETAPLYTAPGKKPVQKPAHHHSDLPAPLPGRKIPVWKRKSIPTTSQTASPLCFSSEPATKWSQAVDPLSLPDNTPKPTRFEWPDEDLPPLNLMDTSFEEISYTSKPLLTQEEEHRASTSFDDLKHIPNANRAAGASTSKKRTSPSLDMEEMKNYVKEQKIRSGMSSSHDSEESIVDEVEVESGSKRRPEKTKGGVAKKVRFDEQENKTTTISIAAEPKGTGGEINHEKIVTEILKKYPQLVKKNKNIRLKIMAKNKNGTEVTKVENVQVRAPRVKVQMPEPPKPEPPKPTIISKPTRTETADEKTENKAPWICDRCSTEDEPVEFVLYYLYRKHMTDVHNEKFDSKLCKYCGHRCSKHNLLMYHLYTKHGMKPPPAYNFPKCDQCPFIALSTAVLNKHKLRHGKNEIQCVECKLAFTSQTTLTSHMQITGHTGKSNKNNYDCQYCTKRYQSGVNLFSHVRLQHKNEAIRDGIVSIDEIDDVEDFEEEENSKDEYILPEIITEPEPPKKVNILSNVKVQERHHHEHHTRHQQLSLEPSSEAEALNNVATGIATSLGLVDIVVLNDNQQLFLQSNQQNFTSDQNEQPEFILPELTGRETFTTTNQNEVITTDGVITQSMLGTGDITSTDELVMVLTDHDYGDNQEEITSDNSNIVVLYSHPVDGQQDQFITTQGNIMVNSQTGLIEIRNGATITSTTTNHHQVVMTSQQEPSPIESIELIQREIESHSGQQQQQEDMKQETVLYEEDSKPDIGEKEETQPMKEQEVVTVNQPETDPLIESLVQGEQLEFTTAPESSDEPIAVEERVEDPPITTSTEENAGKENEQTEVEQEEETVPCPPTNEEENEERTETHDDQVMTEQTTVEPMEVEDKVIEETSDEIPSQGVEEEVKTGEEESVAPPSDAVETETPENEDKREETVENVDPPQDEESEGDKTEEKTTETPPPVQEEESKLEEENPKTEEIPVTQNEENEETQPESMEHSSKTDMMEIEETQEESTEEEKTVEEQVTGGEQEMLSQSDTSTSQFNDENSQSSQESQQEEENDEKQKEEQQQQESVSTKISILDDWEDTDSQQSDQKEKEKIAVAAGETVHKLMDDWEEEDEEEGRKEIDG